MPEIVIIGGPNGAGKTTTSRRILPVLDIREFVNADEMARGLSPYDPEHSALAAGRLMLERMRELLRSTLHIFGRFGSRASRTFPAG
jgi:predicted ABC-type ATPase